MRILMLGNSYTFYNELPSLLAELTGAEVVRHTRGAHRDRASHRPGPGVGS